MAANNVYIELAKVMRALDTEAEKQLDRLKNDNSAAITYINEVTNIIRKELAKVKRLPKAKRAGGLESLRKRYLNLVEENLNSSKAFNNTRDATIIVDKTIVINNGNDTLNSTTLSVKRSSRLASKTLTCIKTRQQKDEDPSVMTVKKRFIEDEVDLSSSSCKRVKLKNDTNVENTVFKKPKPLRGKRKNAEEKSIIDVMDDRTIADEESFFNSNVLSSSPKTDVPAMHESPKPSTSAVVQVKTPSVKDTVAAFERLGSEAGCRSTPRKDFLKNLMNKNNDKNKDSVEKTKEKSPEKKKKASEIKESITPKSQDSQEEDEIPDTDDESSRKTDKKNTTSKTSRISKKESKSLFDSPLEEKPSPKKENLNVTRNLKSKSGESHVNLNVTQTLNTKSATPEGKPENLNVTRTLRSKAPSPQSEIQHDLDKTQVIPVASKRTKPVLKSRIFDADGNNMLSACKVTLKHMESEKTESVFAVPAAPAIETKAPVRKSNRINSDSETENSKSDSELTKSKKRRSSELSEPEPEPASKAKKKSINGNRKSGEAHSDGEIQAPKKISLSKIVKNEMIVPDNVAEASKMEVEPEPEPEAEPELESEPIPAPRPKRTRGVRQAPAKEDNGLETNVPKASKRTKPVKVKEDEHQEEPIRSTRTKTIKTSQTNAVDEIQVPTINPTRFSTDSFRKSDIENQSPVPPVKKRTKMNKKKEVDEDMVIMPEEGGRVTRTKSKAVKQQIAEENQKNMSVEQRLARKSVDRAKFYMLQKDSKLMKLVPQVTLTPDKDFSSYLPSANKVKLPTASKNQVLMNSTNKPPHVYATPISAQYKFLPPMNSTSKKIDLSSTGKSKFLFHPPQSVNKDGSTRKPRRSNSSVRSDSTVRSVTKISKNDDQLEKANKLKERKEKEEEARLKKEMAMQAKKEEIKKKNDLKIQQAKKQKEKLEAESHKNLVQAEKEKEEKRKVLLEERRMKMKEEQMRKKMIKNQKANEVEERRRLEEESRLAKIKEQEAEQKRLELEKQKELERNAQRAKERAEEQKKREFYEQQLKQKEELAKQAALKKKALQLQSANKQKNRILFPARKDWNYKPRNENDYGLEDENSEVESGDEEPQKPDKPFPAWAKGVMEKKCKIIAAAQLEIMTTFMTCYKKTPDVDRMFKMTPSKRIKRTSSAIWNTPSS